MLLPSTRLFPVAPIVEASDESASAAENGGGVMLSDEIFIDDLSLSQHADGVSQRGK